MNFTNKFFYQEKIIKNMLIFFIFINFFLPKINLINISGYHQGIRFENILSFLLLITLIVSKRLELTIKDYKYLKLYLIFFIITLISTYVGWISALHIEIFYIIRLLEILPFIFLLFKSSLLDIKTIEKLTKYFFLISLVGILLQYLGLMGDFNNNKFTGFSADKYSAFTGGPWELATMISLSFFLILPFCKNDIKKFIFYLFLTFIILFLTQNKGVTIAFISSMIFYFIFQNKKLNFKIFSLSVILFSLIFAALIFVLPELKLFSEYDHQTFEQIDFQTQDFLYNLIKLDINYIYQALKEFLINGFVKDISESPEEYFSLHYRIMWWNEQRVNFLENILTIIFGSGAAVIYYESFIIRIIFTLGALGTFFFIYILFRLPIYLIVYMFITAITLDFVASYKITILLVLLHYVNVKKFVK